MTTKRYFLVIKANGQARILTRSWPQLADDEIGFRLVVNFPPGWGGVAKGEVTIQMPEPPVLESTVEQVHPPVEVAS